MKGTGLIGVLANEKKAYSLIGARNRNRTGTPAINEAADFKSAVSTNFTTRAPFYYILVIIVLYSVARIP